MTSVLLDEAARQLGISRRSIYNWIASGHLETIYVGKTQRVLLSSIRHQQDVRRRSGMRRPRVHRENGNG